MRPGASDAGGVIARASVVIPVYERADLLEPCLRALEAAGLDGLELIVVDNASADPAMAPLLDSWRDAARVIRNPANLGFAVACNRGAEAATAPVLVFLNSDTEVRPGWLEPLLDAVADPAVGMAGSRLLYPDGRLQHAGMALLPGMAPIHIHRGAPGDLPAAARSRDLAMVTAACCAIRRDLFARVGGFDDGYRNGFEDVDLCLRLAREGHRARYRGDSVVVHHEGKSPGRADAESDNGTRFRRRWMGWPADWERILAEDGLADCSWADCVWQGPLLDASPEAALGRACVRALAEAGRRPVAVEAGAGPLAADAAELCDEALLAALNRYAVRAPGAERYVHLRGDDALAPLDGDAPVVAVLGPGPAPARGLESADVVLAAGSDALAAAEAAGVSPRRLAALDAAAPDPEGARRAALPRPSSPQGIGWCGPLLGRSGYAAAGRGLVRAAAAGGLPVRALSADAAPPGLEPPPLALGGQDFRPAVWVAHHPPVLPDGSRPWDEIAIALQAPIVGATCFETEGLPPGWVEACEAAVEVWVPSRFNLRTFADAGVDPERLHLVPYPVEPELLAPDGRPRDPDAPVTFLSVFEWTWRKGWDVLLRAWAEEFAPDERVRLRVLTYRGAGATGPGDVMGQAVEHLRGLGHDPEAIADIELVLEPVPHDEMPALYRAADALALPTRGEGAGMPVLEAAACGTPVIATAFGGHEELMDPEIAFPVEVERMVEAPDALVADNALYAGLRLAEPSVTSLRARLREVADDPAGARRRAAGAHRVVCERFSPEAAARALSARSEALLDGRRGAGVAPR